MEPRVVHVEVHGQCYPIKTTLEPGYVQDLAAYVHQKMALASDASPSSDTLALAVLSALNIADELFRMRDQQIDDAGSISERAQALERIVDQALALAGHRENDVLTLTWSVSAA
jgi:cell division protein ZapA